MHEDFIQEHLSEQQKYYKKFYHWIKKGQEWTTFLKGALNEKNEQFVNEDTYQTLTELKIEAETHEKAITPLWKKKSKRESKKITLFL